MTHLRVVVSESMGDIIAFGQFLHEIRFMLIVGDVKASAAKINGHSLKSIFITNFIFSIDEENEEKKTEIIRAQLFISI